VAAVCVLIAEDVPSGLEYGSVPASGTSAGSGGRVSSSMATAVMGVSLSRVLAGRCRSPLSALAEIGSVHAWAAAAPPVTANVAALRDKVTALLGNHLTGTRGTCTRPRSMASTRTTWPVPSLVHYDAHPANLKMTSTAKSRRSRPGRYQT